MAADVEKAGDVDTPDVNHGDGRVSAKNNPPEKQELLHRPHAFALMHGSGGAKIAYGELHWRIDVFTLQFETSTASGVSVTVDDHANHSHAPHADHSHSNHTDHSHSSHTTSNHQHTHAHIHNITDHTHSCGSCGSGSGSGSTGSMDGSVTTGAATPETTGSAGAETLSHSGVKNVSDGSSSAPTGVLGHSNAVNTDGSSLGADSAGVLKHSGVTTLDSSNQGTSSDASGSSSGVLSHNVTVSGGLNAITYCSGASQSAIGNITQQVPKVQTEDGTAMDAGINETKYHELGSFGDVYLVWKVDLENVGGEVEKCWVQVGDPAGTGINEVGMGHETTDRRAAGNPKVGTGQPEGDAEGVFKIKIGTVTESNEITQLVSSDVVWSPTVMDRVKI